MEDCRVTLQGVSWAVCAVAPMCIDPDRKLGLGSEGEFVTINLFLNLGFLAHNHSSHN